MLELRARPPPGEGANTEPPVWYTRREQVRVPRADLHSFGVQASPALQCSTAHAAALTAMPAGAFRPAGVSVTALWAKGEPREAGVREALTHKVRQQDDQRGRDDDGAQGRALPVAVLGGLLEVEGRSGEGAAGQGPGRGRVHSTGRQGVPRRRGAEEWGGAPRLEEEVPVEGEKPERVRSADAPGAHADLEDGGSRRRSMQRSLERERENHHGGDGRTGRRRTTYWTTKWHTKTRFHKTRMGQPYPWGTHPSQGRRCYQLDRRLGVEILVLGRGWGWDALSWGNKLDLLENDRSNLESIYSPVLPSGD